MKISVLVPVYETWDLIPELVNTMRRPSQKSRKASPDIEEILRLIASSKSNWSETISL